MALKLDEGTGNHYNSRWANGRSGLLRGDCQIPAPKIIFEGGISKMNTISKNWNRIAMVLALTIVGTLGIGGWLATRAKNNL